MMKKIFFSFLVLSMMIVSSCETDQNNTSVLSGCTDFDLIELYQHAGIIHNDGLDYFYDKLKDGDFKSGQITGVEIEGIIDQFSEPFSNEIKPSDFIGKSDIKTIIDNGINVKASIF